MQKIQGTMILLVGESGVGKTSLVEAVLGADSRFSHLPGTTTRLARPGEEGKHHFISLEQFEELARNTAFIAQFSFAGNKYGIQKSDIEHALAQGVVIATSASWYVRALREIVERIIVIQIVPVGDWKRREGREQADKEELKSTERIDFTLENSFPNGFAETKNALLLLCKKYV